MKFFEHENLMDELYSEIAKQIAQDIDREFMEILSRSIFSKSINEIIAVQPMTQIITDAPVPFYLNYVYGTTKVEADTIDIGKLNNSCIITSSAFDQDIFHPKGSVMQRYSKDKLRYDYYGRITVADLEKIDLAKFPHLCPRCKSPAYIGFASVECSKKGCE